MKRIVSTLLLSLAAAALCTAATPRKKPANDDVTPIPAAVPADSFSYAMGVMQSQGLRNYLMQREGIDSAHVADAVRALRESPTLSDDQLQKALAYAAGLRIALMNRQQVLPTLNEQYAGHRDTAYTDLALFTNGLTDALEGRATLSDDQAMAVVNRQQEHRVGQLKAEGEAFLRQNAKARGVKTTPSGLQYRVIKQGDGPVATDTTEVEVHYEGRLIDGTIFDSSYQRGQPAKFRPTQVIKGWTEALKMMPAGSVYELFIPYDLAYGERGQQRIPPYSTLIFKVEVLNHASKE